MLFDLDGTLVDTIGLIIASYRHAWREVLGVELADDVIRSWIGRTLPDTVSPYGAEIGTQLQHSYVTFNRRELPRLQRNYPGIRELLADLRDAGVATGIVTSKRRPVAQQSLDVAGLDDIVLLATLEDTATHKPDPAPIQLALATLGRSPDKAVYVGDATVDVLAARAAGCSSIAVTWGAGLPDELAATNPDALITTTGDLRSVLLGAHAS